MINKQLEKDELMLKSLNYKRDWWESDCKLRLSRLCVLFVREWDSDEAQTNWFIQYRDINVTPYLQFGGKLCDFLSDFQIFWKKRTKNSVCLTPLIVVC